MEGFGEKERRGEESCSLVKNVACKCDVNWKARTGIHNAAYPPARTGRSGLVRDRAGAGGKCHRLFSGEGPIDQPEPG